MREVLLTGTAERWQLSCPNFSIISISFYIVQKFVLNVQPWFITSLLTPNLRGIFTGKRIRTNWKSLCKSRVFQFALKIQNPYAESSYFVFRSLYQLKSIYPSFCRRPTTIPGDIPIVDAKDIIDSLVKRLILTNC